MDLGRQIKCSISTSDAQVHLEPDTTGSLNEVRTPQVVILSRKGGEGSLNRWWLIQDSSRYLPTL
jgi:hypothetical protein